MGISHLTVTERGKTSTLTSRGSDGNGDTSVVTYAGKEVILGTPTPEKPTMKGSPHSSTDADSSVVLIMG